MPVRFITDGAAMQELLRGQGGPVFRDLQRRGDMLIGLAQDQILSRKRTYDDEGRLEASIVKRFGETSAGLTCTVIAGAGLNPSYAFWVHEGNGPEGGRIYPTKPKGVLVFEGPDGSQIFARSVRTSKPNRYLADNLPAVVR